MKTILLLNLFAIFCFCLSKYKVGSKEQTSSTIWLDLYYSGTEDYYIKKTSPIVKQLRFVIHCYSFNDFYFKITDAKNSRFQVPQQGVFPIDPQRNFSFPIQYSGIRFEYNSTPFDFRIIRKDNNATLFSTFQGELIYSDYYLQIATQIQSQYIYGLGQRFNPSFRLKNGKWTIFTRDRGQVIDDGVGKQTYGYYPFYLLKQSQNNFHINYFRSSNAMDVIKQQKNQKHYLTYKTIGGVLDFRFFLGINPEGVLQRFHQYIGQSAIPPFWSLGFHQSRWGYQNIDDLQEVLTKYEQNNLPLDTIWSDIDYMDDLEDFTIDQDNFPLDRMKKITDKYNYIPIIDAGIKVSDSLPYNEGKLRDVFIKDANGSQFKGKVWPGVTTFVDFFHPNATKYWGDMLQILYNKVKFSGIWLDMNQYSNFCDGPCQVPTQKGFDYSSDLPYNPGNDSIEASTISLNSTHYGAIPEANVHVFAAFLQTYATNLFLKRKNLRPFIISRSSTLGSNKFGFHWTGDNSAQFSFLKSSIADNFLNQMWGFQIVGPDICGFGLDTTQQLCSRWFQIGTLYTFARNHNAYGATDQQPYALGQSVLQAAKNGLSLRYSLLKHYYSLIIRRKGFGTIFNPLFFIFPLDNNNYVDEIADSQFIIGSNLMAAPILQQGVSSRMVYFSTVNWFNFYTGKLYKPGTYRIQDIKLTDKIPLFIREGTLVLTQQTDKVRSTKDLDNKFRIVSGLHFDSQLSDTVHRVYSANSIHISLDDYQNNSKIDNCLSQNCDYDINLRLDSTQNYKNLTISVTYLGGSGLNGLVIITAVTLYSNQDTIHQQLQNPIQIKGSMKTVIPIKAIGSKHKNQQLQMIDY